MLDADADADADAELTILPLADGTDKLTLYPSHQPNIS